MDVEVVEHQAYLLGLGIEVLGQVAHEIGELASAPSLANFHAAPACERLEGYEEVGHPSPLVLVVAALGTARSEAERLAQRSARSWQGLSSKQIRGRFWSVGLLVEVQHLLHPPNEAAALLGRDHPALYEVGAQFVFLSVFLTVSWETSSTIPSSTALSAKSLMLQRSRPSGASEQAKAIRRASALPSKDLP